MFVRVLFFLSSEPGNSNIIGVQTGNNTGNSNNILLSIMSWFLFIVSSVSR